MAFRSSQACGKPLASRLDSLRLNLLDQRTRFGASDSRLRTPPSGCGAGATRFGSDERFGIAAEPSWVGQRGPLLGREGRPVLAELRAGYPAAADVLARVLRDGTLLAPLSAKPVAKVGAELLEALPASGGDHAD
jgi:hypothetical protein